MVALSRRWFTFASIAAGVAGVLGGAADARQSYEFHLIEAFNIDYSLREVYVWGMNNAGQAVGLSTAGSSYAGFVWDAATDKTQLSMSPRAISDNNVAVGGSAVLNLTTMQTTFIPPLNDTYGRMNARAMNESGVVVGYAAHNTQSNSNGTNQFAFVWDAVNGTRGVDVPAGRILTGINESNYAVGIIRPSAGSGRAFAIDIDTGVVTNIYQLLPTDPLGNIWSEAHAVNDHGLVVGEGYNGVTVSAWTWSAADGFTFLPGLDGGEEMRVHPRAVNNHGEVVGYALNGDNKWRAFIWDAANGMRDLNTLTNGMPTNFLLDRAFAINDDGWVGGDGHYGPGWGTSRGFVLQRSPSVGVCAGDANGDGVVDFADFSTVLNNYGQTTGEGDLNNDGVVNFEDFSIVLANYGNACD